MASRIQIRRGTSAQWASANTVLSQGEAGLDVTTGELKYGDGTTAWADLNGITSAGSSILATGSTTARSSSDRAAEVNNVMDFGATGDGTTDDRAAIQAAIDWTTQNNGGAGTVYFPDGVYRILKHPTENYGLDIETISSDRKITLMGASRRAVLSADHTNTATNSLAGLPLINMENTFSVAFENFTVKGNGETGAAGNGHAFFAWSTSGATVAHHYSNLIITGFAGEGEDADGATDMGDTANTAFPACAIYFGGGKGCHAENISIDDCGMGIMLDSMDSSSIDKSDVSATTIGGIWLRGVNGGTAVTSCTVTGVDGTTETRNFETIDVPVSGLFVDKSQGSVTISESTFSDSPTQIALHKSEVVNITRNVIKPLLNADNDNLGIGASVFVYETVAAIITGNQFRYDSLSGGSTGKFRGIYFQDAVSTDARTMNTVRDNTFRHPQGGSAGDATVVYDVQFRLGNGSAEAETILTVDNNKFGATGRDNTAVDACIWLNLGIGTATSERWTGSISNNFFWADDGGTITSPILLASGVRSQNGIILRNKQSGAGTFTNNWFDLNTDYEVNVKDFGAIGDGVADDGDALQAALNIGKRVFVPAGEYKTLQTLSIPSGTTFEGSGYSTLITRAGSTSVDSAIHADDVSHVVIRDMRVEMSGTDSGQRRVISLWRATHSTVSNIWGAGSYRATLQAVDSDYCTFDNLSFEGTDYTTHPFTMSGCQHSTMTNCHASNAGFAFQILGSGYADQTGTYDGTPGATWSDPTANWSVNKFVGYTIWNDTDGSKGIVTANTATTITATLLGGSTNLWADSDEWRLTTTNRTPEEARGSVISACTAIGHATTAFNINGAYGNLITGCTASGRYQNGTNQPEAPDFQNKSPQTSTSGGNSFIGNVSVGGKVGFYSQNAPNSMVSGLTVIDSTYAAVWLQGSSGSQVSDVKIFNPGASGVTISKSDRVQVRNVDIVHDAAPALLSSGAATGGTDEVMSDSGAAFEVGTNDRRLLVNTTTGATGIVTAVAATSLTAEMTGGSRQTWNSGDSYEVVYSHIMITDDSDRSVLDNFTSRANGAGNSISIAANSEFTRFGDGIRLDSNEDGLTVVDKSTTTQYPYVLRTPMTDLTSSGPSTVGDCATEGMYIVAMDFVPSTVWSASAPSMTVGIPSYTTGFGALQVPAGTLAAGKPLTLLVNGSIGDGHKLAAGESPIFSIISTADNNATGYLQLRGFKLN